MWVGNSSLCANWPVVTLFESRRDGDDDRTLVVQTITVGAPGIEPRQRSLDELKGDDAAPALVKQVT